MAGGGARRDLSARPGRPGSPSRSLAFVALLLVLSAPACTSPQPELAQDWAETAALVSLAKERGSYQQAAHAFMMQGEYELALRGYTRALAEDGASGSVLAGMGAANLQLDRLRQGLALLERASRIAPQSASVWNNMGVALAENGEVAAARGAFTLAQDLDTSSRKVAVINLVRLDKKELPEGAVLPISTLQRPSGFYLDLQPEIQRRGLQDR